MKLKIDEDLARKAIYLSSAQYEGLRRYYDLNDVLIVCRSGLSLPELGNTVVDAAVGWDIAQPGFIVDDSKLGQKRTKITIYRRIRGDYDHKLSDLLQNN
ncbi:MAG: hypothetical protein ACREIQ_02940 [Nitrospiria bacterium]